MTKNNLVCLITGANQGLGFETAKALLQTGGPYGSDDDDKKPYHILLGCRDYSKGEAAAAQLKSLPQIKGTVSPLLLDVTSANQVAEAAAYVEKEHGRLDVLVNNAGVMSQAPTVMERLRATMETNVFGVVNVTEAFLPLLRKAGGQGGHDPRLIFVSSSMGSLTGAADPQGRVYKAATGSSPMEYRTSKAALNMLMVEYWKEYGTHEGGLLRVFSADPGPNATNLTGLGAEEVQRIIKEKGVPGPEVGARQIVRCVLGERDGMEGKMHGVYGVSPW
ncbi:dehydrogenase with different specificitie [Whalleya microplaca]|nr:dehydrogenase with different specificitie [Whalleya microplaca]